MSGWLLDTDVVSAFAPGKRSLSVETVAWFEARSESLYLSVVTAAEIEAGIAKLRRTGAERRAAALNAWFGAILSDYGDRILAFDLAAARIAGAVGDAAGALGHAPGFADIAIAATAKANGLTLLTWNLRHFDPLAVGAADPFQSTL